MKPSNGHDDGVALDPGMVACISFLKQLLADAEAGRINTLAVVACGPSDFGANVVGPNAQAAYMGLGVLQRKIEAAVTQQPTGPVSSIIKPGAPVFPRPRPVPRG
jgi:hypothetical protein